MAYTVDVAATAERELDQALSYIAEKYASPQAMFTLLEGFNAAQEALKSYPSLYSVHHAASEATNREIRRVRVKNYGLFYHIDKKRHEVQVYSFLHSRQDAAWHFVHDLELLG